MPWETYSKTTFYCLSLWRTGIIGSPNKEVHVLVSRTCEYIVLHGRRDHEDVTKELEIGK